LQKNVFIKCIFSVGVRLNCSW